MDIDRLREFGSLIENLGNPNDLIREKQTAELLREIQTNQIQSMLLCIGLVFSNGQLIKAPLTHSRKRQLRSSLQT